MSDLLLSGQPVYEAEIVEPIARAWTATVQLEAEAAPSGQVSLSYKGTTWTGTIYRGGVYGGRYLARIVGGAGGLGTSLAARWYREITLRTVLDDIVRETGEKLSSTVLAAVLDRDVPTWTREAGTAAMALDAICDAFSLSWRVLRDGSVWLGAETWPTVTGTHVVTSERPDDARIEIAPDLPVVLPGSTFRDRRVTETVYTINDSLRCRILFELSTLGEMLRRLVRFFTRDDRYRAAYFGSVIAQNDDGTLDIKLETVTVPSPTQVPIRYGIPGISATVKPGARVAVTYEDGDSRRPVATVWDAAEVEELNVTAKNVKVHAASVELGDGGRTIARAGDIVRSGGLGMTAMFVAPAIPPVPGAVLPMTTSTPYMVLFTMPGSIPSPSLAGQISSFGANKSA